MTGEPGSGKTTLLRHLVSELEGRVPMAGFLTEEVREKGRRLGFQGRTLGGLRFELAHVRLGGPVRVGPYGVNVSALEEIGVPALEPGPETKLVVVDEVGKMESFSSAFREAVERLLSGPVAVVGTVAKHGVGFPKRVRHDPRVMLLEVRRGSWAELAGEILRLLARAGIVPQARRGRDRLAAERRPR